MVRAYASRRLCLTSRLHGLLYIFLRSNPTRAYYFPSRPPSRVSTAKLNRKFLARPAVQGRHFASYLPFGDFPGSPRGRAVCARILPSKILFEIVRYGVSLMFRIDFDVGFVLWKTMYNHSEIAAEDCTNRDRYQCRHNYGVGKGGSL